MDSAGCAAGLEHVAAPCVAGGNPEKLLRIPDLTGFDKTEVVAPRSARSVYDHAIRNIGVKMITVESAKELERALNSRTAMIHLSADHRLDVVGAGPAREELEQLAGRLGLAGRRVVFHGRLDEEAFARRMAVAAAAVSASGHEAFGMAVADALTAGIPAVASFIPAHRELAVMAGDGVPLWLVNPDDEVALAEALRVAAATRRVTHGSNALPTWSDVVLSTREVYASVASRARLTQGAADR